MLAVIFFLKHCSSWFWSISQVLTHLYGCSLLLLLYSSFSWLFSCTRVQSLTPPLRHAHLYSRWSHPVPSLNALFILITFMCLFLALTSLLKSKTWISCNLLNISIWIPERHLKLTIKMLKLFVSIFQKTKHQRPTSPIVTPLSVNEISVLSVAEVRNLRAVLHYFLSMPTSYLTASE